MNKRIKELAVQARLGGANFEPGVVHDDGVAYTAATYYVGTEETFSRFAELIVRECAEMVRIQNEQFMENESHYGVVSTDVLKHFGIEP